jgi:uncharacterized protein YdhG (YjbR/CyaY superfamily)
MTLASASQSQNSDKRAREKVRAYLASLPPDARKAIKTLRDAIRSAAPRAEESFGYGMPAFRFEGRPLVWYAAWKEHTSLYPISAGMMRAHATAMKRYDTSGRGTIRFPLTKPVPSTLVRRIVRTRVADLRKAR